MLDCNGKSQTIEELKEKLTCDINLPSEWRRDWERHGQLQSCSDTRRRFPRFHYRVSAILQCQETFPALTRPQALHLVYTTNISRGGMAFLHSTELFPLERIRIKLRAAATQDLEVVNCRYIDERCFAIGCQFLAELDATTVWNLIKDSQ